jgi:hypothetical protein
MQGTQAQAHYYAEPLEPRHLLAAVFWDGGGDGVTFMNPANWSTDQVPGADDDVTISVATSPQIRFEPPDIAVPFPIRSLVCDERLVIVGILQIETTANINAQLRLQNGSLMGGGWIIGTDDARFDSGQLNAILGASIVGDLSLAADARLRITAASEFTRIRNAGRLFFDSGSIIHGIISMEGGSVEASENLTIAVDGLVSGTGTIGRFSVAGPPFELTNYGTIAGVGSHLAIDCPTWTNHGNLAVNGGGLRLRHSWSSTGVIELNEGTLFLGGTFASASLVNFQRTGGIVNLDGTLNNTGASLTFNESTGSWGSSTTTGAIVGGDVIFTDSYRVAEVTLRDVNVEGRLVGNYTLQGTTRFTDARLAGWVRLAAGYMLRDPVTLVENGRIFVGPGTATIAPEGTLTIESPFGVSIGEQVPMPTLLINQGTIEIDSVVETPVLLFTALQNEGLIRVHSGKLEQRATVTNQASIQIDEPGRIGVRASTVHGAAARFLGDGEISFDLGTHTFDSQFEQFEGSLLVEGGTVDFATSQVVDFPLTLSSGKVTGSGDLTFPTNLTWSGGSIEGTGALVIQPGATLTLPSSSTRTLKRLLQNLGTVSSLNGTLLLQGAGRFANLPGGVVNSIACSIVGVVGDGSFFQNQGTFSVFASDVQLFDCAFDNSGTVNVTAGNLRLNGGGTNSGSLNVSRVLEFTDDYSFSGAARITGAGTLVFRSGAYSLLAEQLELTGHITVELSGVFNLAGGSGPTVLRLGIFENSTATINADISVAELTIQAGGTLSGTGEVTVTSSLVWTSGSMLGSGTTTIAPGVTTITTPSSSSRLARILQNRGTLFLRVNPLHMGDGTNIGIIRNLAGGLLDLTGPNSSFVADFQGNHILENFGTLRSSVTGGTATLTGVKLLNQGLIDVANGTFQVHGGGSHFAGGSAAVALGKTLSFGGNWEYEPGATVGGSGSVRFNGGQHNVDASINVTGAVQIIGGAIVEVETAPRSGSLAISGSSLLRLTPGQDKRLVTGAISISGGGVLDVTDNAVIVDYPSGGPSPLGDPSNPSSIFGLIASGYANGAWNGVGINSSSAATNSDAAIGFGEASSIFGNFPAVFLGEMVDDSSVLIRQTLIGDANLDGTVGLSDFDRVARNFSQTPRSFALGDFNYDAIVNVTDFNLFALRFGMSVPQERSGADAMSVFGWVALEEDAHSWVDLPNRPKSALTSSFS